MTGTRRSRFGPIAVLLAAGLAGCGGEKSQFGYVEGTVTIDGKPILGAQVEFDPVNGSPSYGVTDVKGHYRLQFTYDQPGALIGKHRVRIWTGGTTTDMTGREIRVAERVPERYNRFTELTAEVKPGRNILDFKLVTEKRQSK